MKAERDRVLVRVGTRASICVDNDVTLVDFNRGLIPDKTSHGRCFCELVILK
jgi:hypothetical protein